MKSIYLFIALWALMCFQGVAQEPCAQHIIEKEMRLADPILDQSFIDYQAQVFTQQAQSGARAELIVIPVVFHIVHDNGPEFISDAQIHNAMRIMNQDYAAINDELSEVVAAFTDDIGVADIEFRLAQKDPSGNPTNGIDHIFSDETYVGDDGSKLNNWPRDKYLNIWVTDVIYIQGAAAYAYRPPSADGNPTADGIISNHRYVGNISTASNTSGKTLTHEIGHYLGLPHTWGETNAPGCNGTNPNPPCDGVNNCNLDDGINDTPNCLGVSGGNCQLNRTTCSSLDNIQNFMDYSSCEANFTKGQVNVMRNVLNNSLADRDELWTESNLASTGVHKLTKADYFIEDGPGHCINDTVKFYDASTYGATSWSWKLEGPYQTITSSGKNPEIVFKMPGLYSLTLEVSDGNDTKSITAERAVMVSSVYGQAVPFFDDFSDGSNWISDNNQEEDEDDVWEHVSDIGFDGDGCFKMNALGSPPNRWDDLILASLDLRSLTSISISLDVAYSQLNNSDDDELSIQISTDCGATWRNIWSRSGANLAGSTPLSTSNFEPENSDWETFTINNLPAMWFSGNTIFRVRFTSDLGNNLYLDNFNVTGNYSDVPVLAYPADGATNQGENTTIDWRAVPEVSGYEYEVDQINLFNSASLISGSTSYIDETSEGEDTEVLIQGLEQGEKYFWRVRSVDGSVTSDWSETWEFEVDANGVGIDLKNAKPISIFPNPAKDRLFITLSEPQNVQSIRVMSLDGKVLLNNQLTDGVVSELSLNSQRLSSGIYFLQVNSESSSIYEQFVISK